MLTDTQTDGQHRKHELKILPLVSITIKITITTIILTLPTDVTEPELRVTRNSLYEAFDSSTPGHGGAIQVIRNSLYEPFDKYQQQSDTAGHGGDTHY